MLIWCITLGVYFFSMGEKKPPQKIEFQTKKITQWRIAISGQTVHDLKKVEEKRPPLISEGVLFLQLFDILSHLVKKHDSLHVTYMPYNQRTLLQIKIPICLFDIVFHGTKSWTIMFLFKGQPRTLVLFHECLISSLLQLWCRCLHVLLRGYPSSKKLLFLFCLFYIYL